MLTSGLVFASPQAPSPSGAEPAAGDPIQSSSESPAEGIESPEVDPEGDVEEEADPDRDETPDSTPSIADLAREERARRATTRSTRVYTNEGVILLPSIDETEDGSEAASPSTELRDEEDDGPFGRVPAGPPRVEAGQDQTIVLPGTADLVGTVTDPGLPMTWSQVSGPGTTVFSDETRAVTTASFGAAGVYRLRLEVVDGRVNSSDEVVITVEPAPPEPDRAIVTASAAPVWLPEKLPNSTGSPPPSLAEPQVESTPTLDAEAGGIDGEPPIEVNGEVVHFDSESNGGFSGKDAPLSGVFAAEIENGSPSVWAGEDQTLETSTEDAFPVTTRLSGKASDDGRPRPLSVRWWQLSGPSSVGFGNPDALQTSATFREAGTYLLELRATDTVLSSNDVVEIRVTQAAGRPVGVSITGVERDLPSSVDPTPAHVIAGSVAVKARADGFESVAFEVCNTQGEACEAIGEDVSPPYSVRWDTTSLSNGDYAVRALGRHGDLIEASDHFTVTISQFFVRTTGSPSGDGTLDAPWTAEHALSQPATVVPPGATVWFRGSDTAQPEVYSAGETDVGFFASTLSGSATRPIKVRSFPGETVRLDGTLQSQGQTDRQATLEARGPYTWFMGFEITSTAQESRYSTRSFAIGPTDLMRPNGVHLIGEGTRVINSIIHDVGTGIWISAPGGGKHAYGNVVYNNGWMYLDGAANGNGVYAQNSGLPNLVEANLIGPQFGSGGQFHSAGSDRVNDYTIRSNAWVWTDRLLVGSAGGHELELGGNSVTDNFFYRSHLELGHGALGDRADVTGLAPAKRDVTATGNYLGLGSIIARFWQTATIKGNTSVVMGDYHVDLRDPIQRATIDENAYYLGGGFRHWPDDGQAAEYGSIGQWTVETGHDQTSTYNLGQPPTRIEVLPNAYDRGLANIIIYNWARQPVISVGVRDLDLEAGDRYALRNVLDYYGEVGEVIEGVYDGSGTIAVSMTRREVTRPYGYPEPLREASLPEFGAFRFVRTSR